MPTRARRFVHMDDWLRSLDPHGVPAVAAVRACLTDADGWVRLWAIMTLTERGDATIGPALLPLLDDPFSAVRFDASEALGAIGYHPALAALVRHLSTDPDRLVRVSCAESLGYIGEAEDLPIIRPALARALRHDRAPLVRAYAAEALADLGDRAAIPLVWKAAALETSGYVRAALFTTLCRLDERDALPPLLTMLRRAPITPEPASLTKQLSCITNPDMRPLIGAALWAYARRLPPERGQAAFSAWLRDQGYASDA